MKQLLLLLLTAIFFSSCMTQKKVEKWNDENQEQAAEYCAENFPVDSLPPDTVTVVVVDSSAFNEERKNMNREFEAILQTNDSLARILADDVNCKQYQATVVSLNNQVRSLQNQVANQKPIEKEVIREIKTTVVDSAAAVKYRLANERLTSENVELEKKVSQYKGQARTRLWMLIAFAALVGLGFVLRLKKSYDKRKN